ncbi:MAG: TRAM domain-containing protein [Candidatus Daviesbacteria bacterium]|nr:TRAM domain-containing protein [Candidatus Daviesbacteria bacterium]
MSLKLILRLVMAVFAGTLAVIYSELIPSLNGLNPLLVRVVFTIISGLVGFMIFPDLASKITNLVLALFNLLVVRLATEILNQTMRLPRETLHFPFMSHSTASPTVSLQRPMILDTSAIIDGRLLDVAKTGFLSGTVLIPSFVLTELQQVADSSDFLKRSRGRHGFELVEELKKVKSIRIEIWDREVGGKQVDEKLLRLAKSLHGRIVTTDFNLNRLASVSNVSVLNVNDLANAVKTVAIPGEKLEIKVTHLGKDQNQGIGYLNDGTMVVIKDGAEKVGQNLKVEVTKNLQSPAGRMIFAKITP